MSTSKQHKANMDNNLEQFLESYLTTALWSSNDESRPDGGDPLDSNYSIEDIDPRAIKEARRECREFISKASHLFTDYAQAGHDFWLTRNHHGAGFWDGDYEKGDELTEITKSFRELTPIVAADGRIYFE